MVLGTSRNRKWIAYNASHTPKVKWPTNRKSYRIVGNCPCHLSNILRLTHLWKKKKKSIQRSNKTGLGRKKASSRRLRRGFPQAGWKLLFKKSLARSCGHPISRWQRLDGLKIISGWGMKRWTWSSSTKSTSPIWEVRSPNSHRYLWKKNPMIFTWHE